MNAPELLRAGGWRQGHGDNGQPYWEHAERYGLTRWDPAAALGDELARVSAALAAERVDHAKTTEGLRIAGEAFVAQHANAAQLQGKFVEVIALLERLAADKSMGAGDMADAIEIFLSRTAQPAAYGTARCPICGFDQPHAHDLRPPPELSNQGKPMCGRCGCDLLDDGTCPGGLCARAAPPAQPAEREPDWLTKDFNALYRAARELLRAIDGHWLDQRAEGARIGLSAQLTRLQPAFDETEAARAELAGRAP